VQPKPTEGRGPEIVDIVKKNLDERREKGIQTYGVPLRAGNGRDALWDAYEEALDLCCYLRAEIENRRMADLAGRDDGFWAK
jgi:hypothetical protein